MLIEQLPVWIRVLFRDVTWRKHPNKKTIYITFDDGPIPGITPWVLDILDLYKIKATFFCVGENVQKYPEIYKDILKRGHRTGNHTFNHIRGFLSDTKDYVANVEKAAKYIDSDLFRPPHGDLRASQIRIIRKKYQIIQWDVISRDYNRDLPKEKVLDIVKKYSRNGSIVVFHDSIKAEDNMKYAMPLALEYLLNLGYCFETL